MADDIIYLDGDAGINTLEEAIRSADKLTEQELQKLQYTLVEEISGGNEVQSWSRKLLDHVRKSLLDQKMKRLNYTKKQKPGKAEGPVQVDVINAEICRAGAVKTLVILKRLTGVFPEPLIAIPRVDFAIKAPLNHISSKKHTCLFAVIPGEAGDGLANHIDYFKTRQRAGLAKSSEGDFEIAFIPPGPLSRTILGTDLLAADPALSQLSLGLILSK